MPIFDFKCVECDTSKEAIVKTNVETIECPKCGALMKKQVSATSGIKFNGTGFYATDFKNKRGF